MRERDWNNRNDLYERNKKKLIFKFMLYEGVGYKQQTHTYRFWLRKNMGHKFTLFFIAFFIVLWTKQDPWNIEYIFYSHLSIGLISQIAQYTHTRHTRGE